MKNPDQMTKEELIELVKTLKKQKKYGLVWEDKPEDVVEQCKKELPVLEEVKNREIEKDADGPTNLLIEGDNYHALSVLNYTHAGKIDVIYIDPPYNTGAKDWRYNNDFVDINDTYRHSKWLSMMSNRLRIAKNLLKKDGVLICTVDDNEQAHIGTLFEELFPAHEIHCITIIHNPGGIQGKNFSYCHEYAYFIYPRGGGTYITNIERNDIAPTPLRDWGKDSSKRGSAKNCFYPVLVRESVILGFGEVCDNNYHPKSSNIKRKDGVIEVYPIDKKGVERKWRFSRQSVESIKDELLCSMINGELVILRNKTGYRWKTVWTDVKYNANVYGTQLVNKIIQARFPFPKSLYAVQDCIRACVHSKNGIVLDFFAGSGTTGHAVMMLNKEDGGNRKFILCTNNENKIAEDVTYPRIKKVIEGVKDLPDITGIPANLRYFKTAFVSSSKVTDDTRRELVKRSAEMICVRENTFEKIADNKNFKIYRDQKHTTGILFDLDDIDAFKAKLKAQKMQANIYVFSLSNDTFDEDFEDLGLKHKLCPIPESILEVYRKLFKQ